jgi:hypothetical protein
MNKIDMKKVVKDRIYNQIQAINKNKWDEIRKMAQVFFKEHKPKKAERFADLALANLEQWEANFKQEFGTTQDMHGMRSAMSYINQSQDKTFELINRALELAANGSDPLQSTSHYWLRTSPFQKEFLELCAEVKKMYHDRIRDLHKLENEMLAVITSAKSAKAAAEQLDGLGITMEVPEAKRVQSNLPAVVKLSVDPTLFNKDVAKSQ